MNRHTRSQPYSLFLAGLAVALTVTACSGGGGGGDDKVALDQPNDLMDALDDKVTANGTPLTQVVGTPPASTGITPKVQDIPDATAVPGDTISLPISFPAGTALQSLFAKVPGASSYFQASTAPGGKAAKVGFTALQTIEFRVAVPSNLETGGQFCIEVKLQDTAENVGEPEQTCITVVATAPPTPADDQPSNAEFGSKLLGQWSTDCINVDYEGSTAEDPKGAKLVLGFASGKAYNETIEFYSTTTCNGTPTDSFAFIDGVWDAGASQYSEQAQRWQRPFDFNPNDPDPSIDFKPCYNVLSLNSNATQLYLGLPITFTFDSGSGEGPMPGDCSAEDTRPTAVVTGLPFVKR